MTGIYKITNPKGKVYIGQSIDVEKRFYTYKKLHCKRQPILYNSLKKYGTQNHTFEILCECEISELNKKERYYQDLYCVIRYGLNCVLTNDEEINKKVLIKSEIEMKTYKQIIKNRGLIMCWISNKLKISQPLLSMYLNNKRQMPYSIEQRLKTILL